MIIKIVTSLLVLSMLMLVQGCDRKIDLEFLLEHPMVAKDEAAKCLETRSNSKHCNMVMIAASKLMIVISEQRSDPEAFGQKIIDLEFKYEQTKSEVSQLQAAPDATLKLKATKAKLVELAAEMRMLLAVAGLNSPE